MEQAILDQGAQKFGRGSYSLQSLGGFSENVYEYIGEDGHRFIMKFLDASKYNKASVIRELTWMAYLAENGLHIAGSIKSRDGLLIEEVSHGTKHYYVIALAKASGKPLTDLESGFDVIEQWGRGMGKMHALGKSNPNSLVHRMSFPQWNEGLIFTGTFPEAAGEKVHVRWNEYMSILESFPKDRDSYGIIHNDLHHNNFHVNHGEIIFFDFGDAGYHWFAYDIAIAIYHAVQTIPKERKAEFSIRFIDSFMNGYLKENTLSEDWIKRIPFFMDYRNTYSFIYFSKFVNESEMDERTKNYLLKMKADIEEGTPVAKLFI